MDYITDGVAAGAFSSDIDNQSAGNYQYDGNGNVTAAMGDSLGFVIFDINNQPSAAYKLNGTSVQFKYDANGVRIQKIQGAATTSYILGAGGNTEAVVTGSTALTYNLFAGAENIGQARRSGSTLTRYYYLKDHLGDIRATLTMAGAVDSYEDFYPYGQLMDGRSLTGSADPRYKFLTKERDAETGFDWLDARGYDNRIGRFLSVDPFADEYADQSPYCYASDNPICYLDPSGDTTDTPPGGLVNGTPVVITAPGQGEDISQILAGLSPIYGTPYLGEMRSDPSNPEQRHIHVCDNKGRRVATEGENGKPHDKQTLDDSKISEKHKKTIRDWFKKKIEKANSAKEKGQSNENQSAMSGWYHGIDPQTGEETFGDIPMPGMVPIDRPLPFVPFVPLPVGMPLPVNPGFAPSMMPEFAW